MASLFSASKPMLLDIGLSRRSKCNVQAVLNTKKRALLYSKDYLDFRFKKRVRKIYVNHTENDGTETALVYFIYLLYIILQPRPAKLCSCNELRLNPSSLKQECTLEVCSGPQTTQRVFPGSGGDGSLRK